MREGGCPAGQATQSQVKSVVKKVEQQEKRLTAVIIAVIATVQGGSEILKLFLN